MNVHGDPADDFLTVRIWRIARRGYSRECGLAGWLGKYKGTPSNAKEIQKEHDEIHRKYKGIFWIAKEIQRNAGKCKVKTNGYKETTRKYKAMTRKYKGMQRNTKKIRREYKGMLGNTQGI